MSTAADLTAYIGAFVSVAVAGGTFWAWRRKDRDTQDMTEVVSQENLNKSLNLEIKRVTSEFARAKLEYQNELRDLKLENQRHMDEMEARHREQIKALELDYEQRHSTLRARMADLETDNASLNRQLIQARRWTDPDVK